MHPFAAAAFRRPPHLLTRATGLKAGMTPRQLDRLVRTGEWVAVRRGIYAEGEYVASLVHRSQVQRLYDDAAALATKIVHVRSHESAAVVWGMAVPLGRVPISHLTVPLPPEAKNAPQRSRFRHGVKHHLAPYGPADLPTEIDGIRVLGQARTAADLAREHGLAVGVTAMDAALRDGVTRAELAQVPARMENWPHVTVVRQALELGDPGSESVGETLARLVVSMLGRGKPQTQFGLSDGRRTAFADLRVGRHLFEFDGRQKYQRDDLDDRPPDEVVWEEKKRQDWLCGFKLGMTRLTWDEVWPVGQVGTLERIERELSATERRVGTDIGDLAPYVVKRQRRAA